MFDNTKRFCLRPLVPMIWQLAGRAREPPLFAVNCRIHGTPPLSLNRVPQTLNRALPCLTQVCLARHLKLERAVHLKPSL